MTYLILDVRYLRMRSAEEEGKLDGVELHGGAGEEWILFENFQSGLTTVLEILGQQLKTAICK